jgi:EmrB/QacA subfamily drug resistance transporter
MRTGSSHNLKWTFAITAAALSMFSLDRQIVAIALPSIRVDLHAGLQTLEWTVSGYTLSFCVLLLPSAALGDRFGRRRMFTAGIAIFTAASAACALAPSAGALVAARVVQGAGGSLIIPLSLTILAAATPELRRGRILGAWGAVALAASSLGPVVGGALTQGLSWRWVFWLNVPIGVALVPLARRRLDETHGPRRPLDFPGIALSAAGLSAALWALIEAGRLGWGSHRVLASLCAGAMILCAFLAWERRSPAPMMPLRFFRSRPFAAAGTVSLLAYLAFFGSFFLVAQLLQIGLGASPLGAGLELLVLSGAVVIMAPIAGVLCDRLGPRPLLIGSMMLESVALAWLAAVAAPGVVYLDIAPALALGGVAAAGLFAPIQAALLGAVKAQEQGQASGVAMVIRELGGVIGVAVLGTVFAAHGSTASAGGFLAGFRPALFAGAAIAGVGALAAVSLPRARRDRREPIFNHARARTELATEEPS